MQATEQAKEPKETSMSASIYYDGGEIMATRFSRQRGMKGWVSINIGPRITIFVDADKADIFVEKLTLAVANPERSRA